MINVSSLTQVVQRSLAVTKCYTCSTSDTQGGCTDPFKPDENTFLIKNCTNNDFQCEKVLSTDKFGRVTITRGCSNTCAYFSLKSNGVVTAYRGCCNRDLCNSANLPTTFKSRIVLASGILLSIFLLII